VSTESNTWFGDVRPGELLDIGNGTIKLRIEEKSGQRARLRLEFTKPTPVTRVEPAMAAFARQGVK
jgi:hypothetical protein